MFGAMTSQEDAWDLVDRCAAELGVLPETRQKWRWRHGVPHKWRVPLLQQFQKHGRIVGLDFFDSLGATPATDAPADSQAAE
jgi:hypothetical protein